MLTKTHSSRNINLVSLIVSIKKLHKSHALFDSKVLKGRSITKINYYKMIGNKTKRLIEKTYHIKTKQFLSFAACSKSVWNTEIQIIFTRDDSTLEIFQGDSLEQKFDETVNCIIFYLQNKQIFIANSFYRFFTSIFQS